MSKNENVLLFLVNEFGFGPLGIDILEVSDNRILFKKYNHKYECWRSSSSWMLKSVWQTTFFVVNMFIAWTY